ncbi:PPE family protein [Mycobacterium intracellulare]|uniref:PPE family protein n=1 Tax=Mycobacterium intracellulare TaxID=1767 RepID=UPI00109E80D0|nr:PPE family protein [Mycobacterium intracellulare]
MSLGELPPEINSGRLYSGPGSASMSLAAEAWDETAAQLYDIAESYGSVASMLFQVAQHPASIAVAAAVVSFTAWLNAVAARARQAARQARASADAFESALGAVVPPSGIDANRALRLALVTANGLAQNGPAIADTDAGYERIWAQDADAMYAYAAAAAAASTLAPFDSPPTVGSGQHDPAVAETAWSLIAAPQVVSAGGHVMPVIPRALRALSRSPITTFDACLSAATSPLSKLGSLSAPTDFAISRLSSLNKTASLKRAAALLPLPGQVGGATTSATARLGRASSIGALSVPQSWAKAAMPRGIELETSDSDYVLIDPSNLLW